MGFHCHEVVYCVNIPEFINSTFDGNLNLFQFLVIIAAGNILICLVHTGDGISVALLRGGVGGS